MRYGLLLAAFLCWSVRALDRPGVTYKIFQFPPDKIPRVDGNPDDWAIVPDDYAIGMDQLVDDTDKNHKPNPKDLDVKIKVGWVNGMNRLYFLYEAYDNYWDFAQPGLHNDILEVVVDGDLSGGPLIENFRSTSELSERDDHFSMHGVQAQNYHIMTPAVGKDWALAWGCNSYVKKLPYANAAYDYRFKAGEAGKLVLEFWITPFDYAGCEGPSRVVESVLSENKLIGLSWAILDYDNAKSEKHAFWNLSRQHTMYGKADQLVAFRLMPLEPKLRKYEADWSFKVIDTERRLVAFQDETSGPVSSWKWTFGDGSVSTEQNPIHQYAKGGDYIVVLEVDGPQGKAQREKIWDVDLR
jgi:PKD domain